VIDLTLACESEILEAAEGAALGAETDTEQLQSEQNQAADSDPDGQARI